VLTLLITLRGRFPVTLYNELFPGDDPSMFVQIPVSCILAPNTVVPLGVLIRLNPFSRRPTAAPISILLTLSFHS
jgi:hypothetical protein